MEIVIIILVIIILFLLSYLFFMKREVRRIKKEIFLIHKNNSNNLVNSEFKAKELTELIDEINKILKNEKENFSAEVKQKKMLNSVMLNISHDLRTPLTSALGYTNMLLSQEKLSEIDFNEINIIKERLLRLEELIDSFFVFSKISNESKNIEKDNANLIELLEDSIVSYYDEFKKEDRNIVIAKNVNKCLIKTNKELLKRIFDNLVVNALKHGDGNLFIDFKEDTFIEISFSNQVLSNDLDISQIFDEFYTTDISRTKGNTGLGLAIVKSFTVLLGGKIEAFLKEDFLYIIIKFKRD
ncbi:MAG: HAMP domain-containing histidine kinase [Bacilli bacterium]|jgi:signal transduction histidine kinase|nr:HAMP domain-containing histidine kinase [Bacilli bacterium]